MNKTTKAHRGRTSRHWCKLALRYSRRYGWDVFPLVDKKPCPGSNGFHDATADPKKIRALFKQYPDANGYGIRNDSVRGPVVIDTDGPEGEALVKRLKLKPTLTVQSQPGRRHRYYGALANGARVTRATRVWYDGKRYPVDVLGDGGYVVGPGSLHPDTGQPYKIIHKRSIIPLQPVVLKLRTSENGTEHGAAPPLPGIIHKGQRDDLLTSLAGSMRRRGASEEAIFAALVEENDTRVVPPLSEKDLRRIARSISRKPPVPIELSTPINDINLAARFAKLERDNLRYCGQWREWLVWNGRQWARDKELEVDRRVEAMVREYIAYVNAQPHNEASSAALKALARYTSHRKLRDVRDQAKSQRAFVISPDQLDTDPWLFNVQNGTIDLRTGTIRKHDPADLITKISLVKFRPRAKAPRWKRFVREIMGGDKALVRYLQRAIGYTLTGDVSEQCLFFCVGGGANGKSTLFEVIAKLCGDYATTIEFDTLLHKHHSGKDRDLPRLYHARFANANEAPENARWNEALLKYLTGGDTLHARWLYQEVFNFAPTHTLWARSNAAPTSRDLSHAFWRRMKLIPFTQEFEVDDTLPPALLAELPGILAWAVRGCLRWQQDGLADPEAVQTATTEYRQQQNIYGDFLDWSCERAPKAWTSSRDLYVRFTEWWRGTHGKATPPTNVAFGNGLRQQRDRGLTAKRRHGENGWLGVRLKVPVESFDLGGVGT